MLDSAILDALELIPDYSRVRASACGRFVMGGTCEGEEHHQLLRVLYCGQEWCPFCGDRNSWIHNRRKGRWFPKLQQMESVGYFVIEWRLKDRAKLRSRAAWSLTGSKITRAFKRLGYDRGLRRWHWFGDNGTLWNPHVNILVDGGYISKARLNRVRKGLNREFGCELVVNYSFAQAPVRKLHILKYVTRATFLCEEWDHEMKDELAGFRSSQTWGKWNSENLWGDDMTYGHKLKNDFSERSVRKDCPVCGAKIVWSAKLQSSKWLQVWSEAGMLVQVSDDGLYLLKADSRAQFVDSDINDDLRDLMSLA